MERGSGSEGRRRGGGQHMKCADRQMEELMEDKQTLCSHSVRHLRQAQTIWSRIPGNWGQLAVLEIICLQYLATRCSQTHRTQNPACG